MIPPKNFILSAFDAVRYVFGASALFNGSQRACKIARSAAGASALVDQQRLFPSVDAVDGAPGMTASAADAFIADKVSIHCVVLRS